MELLHSAGIRDGKILLITDGISAKDSAQDRAGAGQQRRSLAIMGVGTATGAPIPLPGGGFLKDSEGTIVMPALDEGAAARAGIRYRRRLCPCKSITATSTSCWRIPVLPGAETTVALERTADTWEDQGYLFLLPCCPWLWRCSGAAG